MATFLSILMTAYMWGACCAYLIIMADVFGLIASTVWGPQSMAADRTVIIVSVGMGLLLPLCFIKRLGALSTLSSIAVLGFIYTSVLIICNTFQV
jgi:hypothetical protein